MRGASPQMHRVFLHLLFLSVVFFKRCFRCLCMLFFSVIFVFFFLWFFFVMFLEAMWQSVRGGNLKKKEAGGGLGGRSACPPDALGVFASVVFFLSFFPTCQVRVVRFYVSLDFLLLLLLLRLLLLLLRLVLRLLLR